MPLFKACTAPLLTPVCVFDGLPGVSVLFLVAGLLRSCLSRAVKKKTKKSTAAALLGVPPEMRWRRGMKRGTEQREEERMWHHHHPTDPPSPSPSPPAQLWPVICERGLNGETAGTLRRGTAAPCSQSGAPGAIHHTPHPGLLWPETEGG